MKKALIRRKKITVERQPKSHLPTNLTRTSPFYPMKRGITEKEMRIDGTIDKHHPWGISKQFGYKLSIFDEDVLMAILYLIEIFQYDLQYSRSYEG